MYELLPVKKVYIPPHPFATDWQAVIFRNFGTVSVSALAKVLKTDEATVEKMKRFARNKMERAISDAVYANGSYADEMEQEALLTEATR